jgi:eukaryotic-like serine/threonine-protein kinase
VGALSGVGGYGRFEVRRLLGKGGMGVVYEAWDRERECTVALKTLRDSEPHLIARLKREFRALADVQHPHLVRLGELFSVDGSWFFTMELLDDAVDVLSYVRRGTTRRHDDVSPTADTLEAHERLAAKFAPTSNIHIDEARLRSCLQQVALGIAALHDAGKVHRDLKPSNVLVVPRGRTVVVDFGLVADLTGEQTSDANVVGTPHYMAPEQAASRRPGPAADWYALGAILYEALTGGPPHQGMPLAVLMDKQRCDPPPPRTRNPGAPPDLDGLCMELLRRDPQDRPSAKQILGRLGASHSPVESGSRSSSSSGEAAFVGRATYLAELERIWRDVANGTTTFVALVGESGIGKSALARRFLQVRKDAEPRTLFLRGRCYEREIVPYKAFDGVVDALVTRLDAMDPFDAVSFLPADAALLTRVFPALRRLPAFARSLPSPGAASSPHDQRARAFKALRELIARLGDRQPLVLCIDDLHWADPDSVLLLEEILRPPQPPRCMLLVTARPAAATDDMLRRIQSSLDVTRILEMEPLDEAESVELARRLLRTAAAVSTVETNEIVREAQGHPLFLHELLRELSATTQDGTARTQHLRLDDVVWRRVHRLPADARRLVELIAVAGVPIPQHVAARAAGLRRDELVGSLSVLKVSNLIRTEGAKSRDSVAPFHDRIREAVLARLDAASRRDHHGRLADALEADGAGTQTQYLIAHLVAAGNTERAAEVAWIAARHAEETLAFDQAAQLYALTSRLRGPDAPERLQLLLALGGALSHAGRGPEAAEALLQAAPLASGHVRLDALQRAAEHLLGSGHLERGLATLAAVLAEIGERPPRTRAGIVWSLAFHRLRVRMSGYRWTRRDEGDVSPSELTRIYIYGAVATSLGHVDTFRAADYQARGLVRALRLGEPKRVCKALAREAVFVALEGSRRSAEAFGLLEKARAIARDLRDPALDAYCTGLDASACIWTGRFKRGAAQMVEMERMLATSGGTTQWELNALRVFHLRALKLMGMLGVLESYVLDHLRDAQHRGDLYIQTSMRRGFNIVWLARDEIARAIQELRCDAWTPPPGTYHVQHFQQMVAGAELALYAHSVSDRYDELCRGIAQFRRSLIARVQVTRCEVHWLRGRLALAMAAETGKPDRFLAEAAQAATTLRKENTEHASAWETLLRAAIHVRRRQDDHALAALRDGSRRAESADLLLVAAVARLREGEILGGSEGDRLVREAHTSMRALGVKAPYRMAELLAPGFRA